MKISNLIIGLVLTLSCFFVKAAYIHDCGLEPTSLLKPVFMNGMNNSRDEAKNAAVKITEKLKRLPGYSELLTGDIIVPDDNIRTNGTFYLAYNDKELLFKQFSEVGGQYLYNKLYNPSLKYTGDDEEGIIDGLKKVILSNTSGIDNDTVQHHQDLAYLQSLGYKFIITAHSQGNMYFNGLYNSLLKNYAEDYRLVSVGSLVNVENTYNSTMIIEENDFITMFDALANRYGIKKEDYSEEEYEKHLFNVTNSPPKNKEEDDYRGHKFVSYLNGDGTSEFMDTAYIKYFNELFPNGNENINYDELNISVTSASPDVEYLVYENSTSKSSWNYLPTDTFSYVTTKKDTVFDLFQPTGSGYKYSSPDGSENGFEYSISCHNLTLNNRVGRNFSLMALNQSGGPVTLDVKYEGMFNDSVTETLLFDGNSEADYLPIGYDIQTKKVEAGVLEINTQLVTPNHLRPLSVEISTEDISDFDIYIGGFYTKEREGTPFIDAIYTCLSNDKKFCNPQPDEDGEYDIVYDYGSLTKTENGYIYELDKDKIPDGYGLSLDIRAGHDKQQKSVIFDVVSDMPVGKSYQQSIGSNFSQYYKNITNMRSKDGLELWKSKYNDYQMHELGTLRIKNTETIKYYYDIPYFNTENYSTLNE